MDEIATQIGLGRLVLLVRSEESEGERREGDKICGVWHIGGPRSDFIE
jgi:hypothetical protein